MKRLKKIASGTIDDTINTIVEDNSSRGILDDYIIEYCEEHVPELYEDDEYLMESDIKNEIDKSLRDDYTLSDFVEKFLDLVDTDEQAEELYNSKNAKVRLAEELFTKYDSDVNKSLRQALDDFKESL